jgi:hypothetical protein
MLRPHSDVVGTSPQELEKEFRQEIEKLIPITDPEFRVLCAGLPLDDEERMQLLYQEAQSDYEPEYENCCKWIEQFRLRVT